MTSKQRKHFASILGICSVLTLLGGCQKNTENTGETSSNTPQNTEATTTRVQVEQTESFVDLNETSTPQQVQVSINNRCVGCGKCVMIAPETFSLQGRRAEVISQAYAREAKVQQAMRHCPEDAIELG